jgi:hypothetical protein
MSGETHDPLIQLAERVASIAAELGIATALIGATALAAHNYVRGTADIDLATAVDPFRDLGGLRQRLEGEGFLVELNLPDAEDSLGGVLSVRARSNQDDPVEIVNFLNPLNPSHNPGREAVETAEPIGSSSLRCATLAHLIALKLYAGSRRDQADVVELLLRNPTADRATIRAVCARYGSASDLDELIREA